MTQPASSFEHSVSFENAPRTVEHHESRRSRKHRRRIVMAVSYTLSVLMALCVLGAVVIFTAHSMVNNRALFEQMVGGNPSVSAAQRTLESGMESLAVQYGFSAESANAAFSDSAMNRYADLYADAWYDLLHGATDTGLPVFPAEELRPALEGAADVEGAISALQKAARSSLAPMNATILSKAFGWLAAKRVTSIVQLLWLALGLLLVLAGVLYALNPHRLVRVCWYCGSGLLMGGALSYVLLLALRSLPVIAELEQSGTLLYKQLRPLLRACSQTSGMLSLIAVLLGGAMMLSYALWLYRCNHYTHNELFNRY
ncbi:MAG: hypothetical protein PHY12_01320 [Eubacteriales bacterium]|nr:hypothetical protein [Eubacteriales bacterium]